MKILKVIKRRFFDSRIYGVLMCVAVLCAVMTSCDLLPGDKNGGTISLVTKPADAYIVCDGVEYGSSPVTVKGLSAGRHLVVVNRDGFKEKRITVNLLANQVSTERIELEPITGLLLIESNPDGAEVTIDDAYKGETPLLIHDIEMGSHRLKFYKESYFHRELTVKVSDRAPQLIETELISDSATVAIISSPPGGAVTVNGASMGETPCRINRIKTGEATVEITRAGYLPFHQSLLLRAGEAHRVDATLIPLPAGLTVYSVPEKARVYVDDQYRGETSITLTNLTVGSCVIRVEKRGFENQQRSIELAPGARRIEEFRLDRNSGKIVLVTEPARVKVYLDGELVGVTVAGSSEILSDPLEIDMVESGYHKLQLARKGYGYPTKEVNIQVNQILSMHETMNRFFVPDTIIRTGDLPSDVYRGIVIRKHPNGDIEMETHPGIIVKIPSDTITAVEPLNASEMQ